MSAVEQVWSDFVGALPSERKDRSLEAVLESATSWLERNLDRLPRKTVEDFRLQSLVDLSASDYPVEYSTCDIAVEMAQFRRYPPISLDGAGMRICNLVFDLVAPELEQICPSCSSTLRLLESPAGNLVLACDRCDWTALVDGEDWRGPGPLSPARRSTVRGHESLYARYRG